MVAAVNFAREHNLRVVIKGGGHSYTGGSSAPDSLLIWTRHMNQVTRQLGDLLRVAYDTDDQLFVPLGRELEWPRGYAVMMAERYRGQLTFELEVEPGLETLTVPRLQLQRL